ncbi:hypothetical protein [Saccharopolyspora gloriosae]|uniref:hypothetical protein n=1 Tax=Saccharopolyspora gloriosae TaxID=455344 RepID=UPI001FB86076|nr:hypothetical protein [Saccharopolyspora gloriosae]
MLWPDEVRPPEFGFLDAQAPQTRPQEQAMAAQLVESLSADTFDPARYRDTYRDALLELIDAKLAGRETTVPAPRGEDPAVVDLATALQASIDSARANRREAR